MKKKHPRKRSDIPMPFEKHIFGPFEGVEYFGEVAAQWPGEPRPRHPDDVDTERARQDDEEPEKF